MDPNETHDPKRRSWVDSANRPGCEFPLRNLPLGVFGTAAGGLRGGVAIGDRMLDLAAALEAGLFRGDAEEAARAAPTLAPLMALGGGAASALRAAACDVLAEGGGTRAEACLVPAASAA